MPVDLTAKVRFDLPRGAVLAAEGERALLVSPDALAHLIAAAGEEIGAIVATQVGASMGKRAIERLGGPFALHHASVEDVVTALAVEVAVAGFGALALERWGRAMVLTVDHAPIEGFVAPMLQGAIEAATGKTVRAVVIATDRPMRVLVTNAKAVERVRAWLADGITWGEALVRLQPSEPRGGA